ncbi:MAG: HAD-IC family P-type ATPase, partial [Myxococcales bacterium]|nr:HAD-IC family P-type ATPase [Myxococcales bacterium]
MDASPDEPSPEWHTLSVDATMSHLQSTTHGLAEAEVERRVARYGPNELQAAGRVSPWAILFQQFKNVLIIILLIATAISAVLGEGVETIAIAVIVLFAVVLGFIQEYRAERAIEALRQMAAPTVTVIRDGQEIEIPARELVPGDVILLHAGDKVAADARLLESINLHVDEAALTGESVPVTKATKALRGEDMALGDRNNMVFGGTIATYGRGRAVVVGTGMRTQFGRIAQMLQSVETGRTPLQQNLDKVGRVLGKAAVAIVAAVVVVGLLRDQPVLEMFIFGIALAVAAVPEALPAVVTISLAIGVQRMVKRNALVRRLPAVETLGSTSVICSDKTGTLTKDEMTARTLRTHERSATISGSGYEPEGEFALGDTVVGPSPEEMDLLRAAALVCDAHLVRDDAHGGWQIKGDPTEGAIIVAAAKAGMQKDDLDLQFPRVGEIPFTSEAKRMTTLHAVGDAQVAYAKGAPETILDSCSQLLKSQGEVALGNADREAILEAVRQMASEALRVLGVASKADATLGDAEHDMTFLGLVGMIDPPRPEAKAAVEQCERAGIRVVMITGDHPITAQAVGGELGLLRAGDAVTGAELEDMSDEELESRVESIEVYARVSPAHKLRVVSALQQRGHIVAMTGDGVNDA